MFLNRAAALRGRLAGDALAEADLSPDEHIEIQTALAREGFLQNRVRGYGASADGQFGPNTRSAIKDFQRNIGANPTGYLSAEQRITLIESPEERKARAARIAAEQTAQQEAIEAQKRAEDETKRAAADAEKKRLEEETARAAAQKREEEQAKQAAAEAERKHLEEEAARAAEWRQKIAEAQKKGTEYAEANDLKWSLLERTNPMTDEQDYTVSSVQPNGTGALAAVSGLCSDDQVLFEATLHDANDPKVPLGFAQSSLGGIIGKKRINDASVFATNFPLDKWGNRIVLTRLSFQQGDAESAETTWRVLTEIETSQGTLYIKIPTLDSKIQKLIAACKRQHEIDKRRQGPPNSPG